MFQIEQIGRFLRFVGRCKDLIIRGGANISPEQLFHFASLPRNATNKVMHSEEREYALAMIEQGD